MSTGEVYTGGFEHGLMCGEGTMEYTNSMKYRGAWLNNLVSQFVYGRCNSGKGKKQEEGEVCMC